MRRCVLYFVLCMFCFASYAGAAETQYLGVVPFYAPEKIWNLYTPFINWLQNSTGLDWELKIFPNHESMLKSICGGEVSVAFLGPVPFGRALEKCGVRPLIVALSSDGRPFFTSIIVTTDPEIRSLKDVSGKSFGFFEGSTAAHVLPRKMLAEEGIGTDSLRPVFFKGQDKIVEALLKREISAAGIKEALYERFKGSGLRKVKESDPVPNFVFCAPPSLKADVEKKFITALTALQPRLNEADRSLMQGWDDEIKYGFILPPKKYQADALKLVDIFKKYSK